MNEATLKQQIRIPHALIILTGFLALTAVGCTLMPQSLHNRAAVREEIITSEAEITRSTCKIDDQHVAVAGREEDNRLTVAVLNSDLKVKWKKEYEISDETMSVSMAMFDGKLAIHSVIDDDSLRSQVTLVDPQNGNIIDDRAWESNLSDDGISFVASNLDQSFSAVIRAAEPSDTVLRDDVDAIIRNLDVYFDLDKPAVSAQVIVPEDNSSFLIIPDKSSKSIITVVLRDSIADDADEFAGKFVECLSISDRESIHRSYKLVDTIGGEKAEMVTAYPALRNDSTFLIIGYHADDDYDLRRIQEYHIGNNSMTLVFDHIFSNQQIRLIADDSDLEEHVIRGIHHVDNGTLVILENLTHTGAPPTAQDMGWQSSQSILNSQQQSTRALEDMQRMTGGSYIDHRITLSETDRAFPTFETEKLTFLLIDEDGNTKWVSSMGRTPMTETDSQNAQYSTGPDGGIYLDDPIDGKCSVVWRDYDSDEWIHSVLDLDGGTMSQQTPIMSFKSYVAFFGFHRLEGSKLMLFSQVNDRAVHPISIKF